MSDEASELGMRGAEKSPDNSNDHQCSEGITQSEMNNFQFINFSSEVGPKKAKYQ
jgi:hypothetical protein